MKTAIILMLLIPSSCATLSARSCIPPDLGGQPAGLETRETLSQASDAAERYQRLYADWKVRVARMLETEPVINACR